MARYIDHTLDHEVHIPYVDLKSQPGGRGHTVMKSSLLLGCPMTQWTQKSTSRLPEDTQASRWTHGCSQPGRGIGPHSILP